MPMNKYNNFPSAEFMPPGRDFFNFNDFEYIYLINLHNFSSRIFFLTKSSNRTN